MYARMPSGAEQDALERESLDLLAQLLQADTTNPPGNETRAARVLVDYFAGNGIDRRAGRRAARPPEPDRRRRGRAARAHAGLARPPRRRAGRRRASGACRRSPASIKDGYVWGRGATDMKNQVAAEAVALARLAALGRRLRRHASCTPPRPTRSAASTAASGGSAQHRPDLVRCDYLLNEGGGIWLPVDGTGLFPWPSARRRSPSSASGPGAAAATGPCPCTSATRSSGSARVIGALADHDPPAIDRAAHGATTSTSRRRRRSCARASRTRRAARAAVRELRGGRPEVAAGLIEPLLGTTFSPTVLHAGGEAVNVIPTRAAATSTAASCRR